MDRDQLRNKGNQAAADSVARHEAAEVKHDARLDKAGEKLMYMEAQDATTKAVREWMDFAGVDRSQGTKHRTKGTVDTGVELRTDRLAQQTRGLHGAAHTDSRRLLPMSHTVENVTSFETSRSNLIKVGDGFFDDDGLGRTEMYIEFSVEEPTALTGNITRRQLSSPKPRISNAATKDQGRLGSAWGRLRHGPALGTHVVEDNGEPAATGVGIRIYRGPAAGVLLVKPDKSGKRPGWFNRDAKLPSGEMALCQVDTYDARLLDWQARRDLTNPQRVADNPEKGETVKQHHDRINKAIHFAGNVHLPYENFATGGPNPLKEINDILNIVSEEQAAGNIARAVDIT